MWKVHLSLISVSFSLLSIFSPSLFREKNLFFEVHLMVSQSLSSIPVISSWPENRSSSLPYHELSPFFFLLSFSDSVPSTILFLSLSSCTKLLLAYRWIHQGYIHKIRYTIVNYSLTQNSLLSNSLISVDAVGEFAKRELFKRLKEGERENLSKNRGMRWREKKVRKRWVVVAFNFSKK